MKRSPLLTAGVHLLTCSLPVYNAGGVRDPVALEISRMFAQAPTTPDDTTTGVTVEPSRPSKPGGVREVVKDSGFIVWSLALAGVLLLAAVVFFFFDRWRKRPVEDSARDLSLSLDSFKTMYENGELTEAEYERIKVKWASKMKEKVGAARPTLPPEPPPPFEPPTS